MILLAQCPLGYYALITSGYNHGCRRCKDSDMALKFAVPDMACSACANTITQAIHAVDPKATVMADVATKQVTIETQEASDAIKQAIVAAGYTIA